MGKGHREKSTEGRRCFEYGRPFKTKLPHGRPRLPARLLTSASEMAPSPIADGGAASSAEKPPESERAGVARGLAVRLNIFASIIIPPAAGTAAADGRAAGDAAAGTVADKKPKPEPIAAAGVGTSILRRSCR